VRSGDGSRSRSRSTRRGRGYGFARGTEESYCWSVEECFCAHIKWSEGWAIILSPEAPLFFPPDPHDRHGMLDTCGRGVIKNETDGTEEWPGQQMPVCLEEKPPVRWVVGRWHARGRGVVVDWASRKLLLRALEPRGEQRPGRPRQPGRGRVEGVSS
jgi:hypothetical protein